MSTQAINTEQYVGEDTTSILRWNLNAMSQNPTRILPPGDLRERIRKVSELPPLPEVVRRLMALMNDPDADAVKLAGILELDPMIAAQMLHWANSAYYNTREPVTSIRDAVARVLGFDQALNLTLGLASLEPLKATEDGIAGRTAVWRHGLQSSALMHALSDLLAADRRPPQGLIQLAGLTQNIGYMLLGHLFPAQFAFLNRMLDVNQALLPTTVENFALGVDHCQLGLWLFETWEMPVELQLTVRHHHNPNYQGAEENLVLLTCLADGLLAEAGQGLGPQPEDGVLDTLMRRLDIDPDNARALLAD